MRALDRPEVMLSLTLIHFVMTGIKGVISTLDLVGWLSSVPMRLG